MAQIIFISQPVIQHPGSVANLAAFGSACPILVAALRGARHPKSAPEMPIRKSGTEFLLPK
jgi:hypothetical protein